MRILHVITGLGTGGAEASLYKLLAQLPNWSGTTAVVSLGDEGTIGPKIRGLGVEVYALDLRAGLSGTRTLARLLKLAGQLKPRIVQGWMYHGNLAASAIGEVVLKRAGVAWNVRQGLDGLRKEKRMTRWAIRAGRLLSARPEAIVYNGVRARQQHEAFGFVSSKSLVIPNGVDVERFAPQGERGEALRNRLGIPTEALVVGHVARRHPMKDHERFLRVTVRLAHFVPDVHFILSGRGVSTEDEEIASILTPSVRCRFHFLGERSDVPDLMRSMDVFCQSSLFGEAFPNVLSEAMAMEVPCVATDVGDSAAILGDTGVIVPPGADEVLLDTLLSMLKRDPAERIALGQSARDRIKRHFSLDAMADRYAALYERLGAS